VKDLRSLLRPLNGTGGYLVTHVGRITRLDGKPIAYEAVDRLMQETCWWLSLLRGERTGPVLVVGVNDGHEVWERWDRATVSPWHGRWSWLPEFVHDGEVFSPVTDGGLLHQLDVHWPDGTWRDATSRVIDWYNQALSSSSLSRIIMAQAGIELMSWYSLVAPGSLSEDGFDKLAAADSLRLALRFAQVDPAVPVSLGALDAAAAGPKGRKALDGPAAITEVRNGLVHPKASGRFADPGAQYEASVLAIRYLELLVLRSLNFDGSMWDRTRGVTGKPPWL
jgi:hypothetical protein